MIDHWTYISLLHFHQNICMVKELFQNLKPSKWLSEATNEALCTLHVDAVIDNTPLLAWCVSRHFRWLFRHNNPTRALSPQSSLDKKLHMPDRTPFTLK